MERLIMSRLLAWKKSVYRKPLLLKGARQVGKTWLLKEFGRTCYENTVYLNFDENPEYRQFFATTKDVHRILPNLAMASGQVIKPAATLLVFDEIQDCPEVLNSLKYFKENAPEYHVACAGSLLGIALAAPSSFPVGQVDFLSVSPMSFGEFLLATGSGSLAQYLSQLQALEAVPEAFFNPLVEKLKMYFVTGGMPEAVRAWAEEQSAERVQQVLQNVIYAYERDFAKHPEPKDYPKISLIWQSVPSQLARENKKFLYNVVKPGARAREYEDALQWLVNAELACKVYRITKPGLPLAAYDDLAAFKIYLSDIGVLRRLAKLAPSAFREENRLFTEFKGALTENYILQALLPQLDAAPHYWSQNNPPLEVDFIIQVDNEIIPVEVKADTNVKSRSLKKYTEKFQEQTQLRVRFSLNNLQLDDNMLNIPLFLADHALDLISRALARLKETS